MEALFGGPRTPLTDAIGKLACRPGRAAGLWSMCAGRVRLAHNWRLWLRRDASAAGVSQSEVWPWLRRRAAVGGLAAALSRPHRPPARPRARCARRQKTKPVATAKQHQPSCFFFFFFFLGFDV